MMAQKTMFGEQRLPFISWGPDPPESKNAVRRFFREALPDQVLSEMRRDFAL